MFITRNIKCTACGYKGNIEAHDTIGVVPASEIFKHLGKDPSGYLHFRCPKCDADLAVDPLKVLLGTKKMVGYPDPSGSVGGLPKNRRYVPIIYGALCLFAVLLMLGGIYLLGGSIPPALRIVIWLAFIIISGILLMLGWVSIKTGLFASDKEISELTGPGAVSEDTKRKFQDRL